jgi:hypothetical protein
MKKSNKIDVETLNKAMKSSAQKATRVNKALELDTVLVKGNKIVRITPDGRSKTIKKLKKRNRTNGVTKPIKLI